MTALLRSELLKLLTTRAWIGYLVALVALAGIGAASQVGGSPDSELGDPEFSRDVLGSALVAGLLAFLLGIMSVTAEWRHGTITRTFLVTPRRERVLLTKGVWALLLGAVLAVLAIAIVLAIAVPWLSAEGSSYELDGDVLGRIARIVIAAALWGALGVGLGALIQNQTTAMVFGVLWVILIEALINALLGVVDLDTVGDFLPGRALSAFEGSLDDGLTMWGGGAVALVWVVALNFLGQQRVARNDLT